MGVSYTWPLCGMSAARFPEASGAGGEPKACFQTGAHTRGVCHHCCRRIPRDHARKRAQSATVLTAFDNPMPLSLRYAKGYGTTSYFPLSAITDRFYARNHLYARKCGQRIPALITTGMTT
jgi:hypothetical protein